MLKDTLVVWGGEFGRTPFVQGSPNDEKAGRDHNPWGFTIWMAGGGVKGGPGHRDYRRRSACAQWTSRIMSTIFTRPFCICWVWTTCVPRICTTAAPSGPPEPPER